MKNKILTFILGILVGAIIVTLGFYIYEKNNNNQQGEMPSGNMPQMTQQQNGGTPPEKPSGEPSGEHSPNSNSNT